MSTTAQGEGAGCAGLGGGAHVVTEPVGPKPGAATERQGCGSLQRMVRPLVAVLFARSDSVYKTLPECDVWDAERDALNYPGGLPVIAHPPCRAWGRLRHFARPREGERELALWAVEVVRREGGALEHPAASLLWPTAGLPKPGHRDAWGGWTLAAPQWWWGHRAQKPTLLYIVGVEPRDVPDMPLRLGKSECVIRLDKRRPDGTHIRKGDADYRPALGPEEREATPLAFAKWLVELSIHCARSNRPNDPKLSDRDPRARV